MVLLTSIKAKPFLKWAGGKTQLIPEIDHILVKYFVNVQDATYIEPFVGGGAVLFHVLANFPSVTKVIINDINQDLIRAYQTIKNNPQALIKGLKHIEVQYYGLTTPEKKKRFYLQQRQLFNHSSDTLEKTILLLFLNKTCFNGLYRVNSKGLFNVPFGNYVKPKICHKDNLMSVHYALQKVEILCDDFEKTLTYAQSKNTIFYLDPPYKPLNTTSAFTAYSKENFSDTDQIRLKEFCDRIHEQGSKFILSNSDVKNQDHTNNYFDELYQNYTIKRVRAKRAINSKANGRGEISELLISN